MPHAWPRKEARLPDVVDGVPQTCLPLTVPTSVGAVGFIGAGRLSAALAAGMLRLGFRVEAVASRQLASARVLATGLGDDVEPTTDACRVAELCQLVFLVVPDAVIAPVCRSVAWEPKHLVVHCGGAVGLDALATAREAGALAGCLHPLQSFPSRQPEPERFRGVFCGIEGDAPLRTLLERIATDFGARTFRLEGVNRALYHAAAVFVSNHLVALVSAAGRAWAMAGLPADLARDALSPLLLSASHNVAQLEVAEALTGPVARGDVATVRRHLEALAADSSLAALYRELSAELLRLPLRHRANVLNELRRLLKEQQ